MELYYILLHLRNMGASLRLFKNILGKVPMLLSEIKCINAQTVKS